jgi:predicted DNA-binding transcriptional regulator YafY
VKELAEQLAVSKATVQRDLATLERDFALVDEVAGQQKRTYRIDHSVRALESLTFGTTELLALHGALAGMSGLAGTPLHDDLRSVTLKIRGFLSPRHNGGLDAIARVFSSHPRGHVDHGAQAELIDQLADAVARKRRCTLTYHAAWKGTTRSHVVRPLRLVWHRSALYLLACLGEFEDITTLAVQRIKALEVTSEQFRKPKVDVDAHIRRAFGIFVSDTEEDVEIRFDQQIAWRIEERTYHTDERKQRTRDGSLRYRIRSSAQWEIVPWVLSFGRLAELVKPRSWRDVVASDVATMLDRYRVDSGKTTPQGDP